MTEKQAYLLKQTEQYGFTPDWFGSPLDWGYLEQQGLVKRTTIRRQPYEHQPALDYDETVYVLRGDHVRQQ